MKEHRPPSAEEWVSWVLLTGVVAASLLGSVLPAWQLVGRSDSFCPGIFGTMGGCIGLLIWLLSRARSTKRPDWVSLIAVGVMLVPVAVLILSIFPTVFSSVVGGIDAGFWFYFEGDRILKWPTAIASLGYVVLVVRRLERALRWKTKGALWSSAALIVIVIAATIIAGGLVLSRPQSTPVPVVTTVPTAAPRAPGESGIIEPVPVTTTIPTATPRAPEEFGIIVTVPAITTIPTAAPTAPE